MLVLGFTALLAGILLVVADIHTRRRTNREEHAFRQRENQRLENFYELQRRVHGARTLNRQ